ncbi:MAG TPA: cytochrome c oxidase assembly protein [Propionibacteriaceae bacterium]|nr:cytochrome c oxidase assembly protein [Propionibacteriaceae bacterium]
MAVQHRGLTAVPDGGDGASLTRARSLRVMAGMFAAGVVVAVGLLAAVGQFGPVPLGVPDAGLGVRVALPVARTLHDLTAALSIGLLGLAVWAVAPEPQTPADSLVGTRLAMVRAASFALGAWLAAAVAVLLLTVAEIAGMSLTTSGFAGVVASFITNFDLGRALTISLVLVAVAANVSVLATRVATAGWAAVIALLALLPLAFGGHAAGASDHQNSVDTLAFHLVGVSLWVGGLAALLLMTRRLAHQLPAAVRRYSTLAGWCFAVVAVSGIINAVLRLDSLANLTSSYGLMVIGKAVALGLLGLAGYRHRAVLIDRLDSAGDRRPFFRLVAVELLVMGAAVGLGVALSRSAPGGSAIGGHPEGGGLLGFPAPPPISVGNYFTHFYADALLLAVAAVALGWYLYARRALRRGGSAWSWWRTAFWMAGCFALAFVSSGGAAVYGRMSFSGHMLQHMGLMVVVPLLLVLGAPVTLFLATGKRRVDGSLGPRETLESVMGSAFFRMVSDPVTAAGLFILSLPAFYYYTGAFSAALFTHTGHVLMSVGFLAIGTLLIWAVLGGPSRDAQPYSARLIVLAVVIVFLVLFAVTLMRFGTVLAPRWWEALSGQSPDTLALLADQHRGGWMALVAGGLPLLALGAGLAVAWSRDVRRDRAADAARETGAPAATNDPELLATLPADEQQ